MISVAARLVNQKFPDMCAFVHNSSRRRDERDGTRHTRAAAGLNAGPRPGASSRSDAARSAAPAFPLIGAGWRPIATPINNRKIGDLDTMRS